MKHDMSQFNVPHQPNPGAFYGQPERKQEALDILQKAPFWSFCGGSWVNTGGLRMCMFARLAGGLKAWWAEDYLRRRYNLPESFIDTVINAYDTHPGSKKQFALRVIRAIPPGADLIRLAGRIEAKATRNGTEPNLELILEVLERQGRFMALCQRRAVREGRALLPA